MITVIDYGAGNIRSVSKALEAVGAKPVVSDNPKDIRKADKIVLPGVGAFGNAVEALRERNLIDAIAEEVYIKKPFLGICLGLQLIFPMSEENPDATGLSFLSGKVQRFSTNLKVPHLGWNQVSQIGNSPLWEGIPDRTFYYFAHSYYIKPKETDVAAGTTEYGVYFTSAVTKDNLFGVQFHPEKSQKWGLKVLENFVRL